MKLFLSVPHDENSIQIYSHGSLTARNLLVLSNAERYLLAGYLQFTQKWQQSMFAYSCRKQVPTKVLPVCFCHCCYALSEQKLSLTSEIILYHGKLILNMLTSVRAPLNTAMLVREALYIALSVSIALRESVVSHSFHLANIIDPDLIQEAVFIFLLLD